MTKNELGGVLWSLGQHPAEKEMDATFHEYGVNHNGALDFGEFRRLMTARLTYQMRVVDGF